MFQMLNFLPFIIISRTLHGAEVWLIVCNYTVLCISIFVILFWQYEWPRTYVKLMHWLEFNALQLRFYFYNFRGILAYGHLFVILFNYWHILTCFDRQCCNMQLWIQTFYYQFNKSDDNIATSVNALYHVILCLRCIKIMSTTKRYAESSLWENFYEVYV